MIKLFDLWYLDWQKGTSPSIRIFDNYIGILMGYMPEACDQRGCCSIQHVIEADGSVYPCDFYVIDKYYLGNIREKSLEELYERGRELRFMEESLENKEECEACEYGYLCRGGCRRNRQLDETGQLGLNYFCPSYKMLFQAALPRMREVAAWLKMRGR